jgi:hypothetical protein
MATVTPPMITDPLRASGELFACAVMVTVPGPVPDEGLGRSQGVVVDAVHVQVDAVVSEEVTGPPVAETFSVVGATAYVQAAGGGVVGELSQPTENRNRTDEIAAHRGRFDIGYRHRGSKAKIEPTSGPRGKLSNAYVDSRNFQ